MQQLSPESDREDAAAEPPPRTPEAFAERYVERVHRFALMVSPPGCDAEDLAQDALVRALRGFDTFDPALGSMDAWLWRIVVNLARDAGRVSGRAAARLERLSALAGRWGSEESAEVLAIRQIGDRELLAAVRRLPGRYRTVIALPATTRMSSPRWARAPIAWSSPSSGPGAGHRSSRTSWFRTVSRAASPSSSSKRGEPAGPAPLVVQKAHPVVAGLSAAAATLRGQEGLQGAPWDNRPMDE